VQPMLATSGALPTGPGWGYELKWDGVRLLVDCGPDGLKLTSRRGNDVAGAYPELLGIAQACPDMLLDGEVVALADGKPSFAALQSRMHVRSPQQARRLAQTTPVTFFAFDVLRLYGVDLTARPYSERRSTLERLDLHGPHWTVPPAFDDGPATAAAAKQNGLEGVVAKRLTSAYRPGARSNDWIKVKFGRRQEFVVGGWEHGEGVRANKIGSLLLGTYDDGGNLVYAGQVGTGFTDAALTRIGRRLGPLSQLWPPFLLVPPDVRGREITWVTPEVVVDVEFAEWTPDGRLRFASFQGERNDKDPREVRREYGQP
jgi:bifunctional non-homologous end joining protein LigD